MFDLDPSRIDEEFLKSHPPISKACDLMLIAKERNKQRKEDELNYLLNEVEKLLKLIKVLKGRMTEIAREDVEAGSGCPCPHGRVS